MYGLPGGHVEINESNEEAIVREVKEETNQDIVNIKLLGMIPNDGNECYIFSAEITKENEYIIIEKEKKKISEIKWLLIEEIIENFEKYNPENRKSLLPFLLGKESNN